MGLIRNFVPLVDALKKMGVRHKHAYKIYHAIERLQLQDCSADDLAAMIFCAQSEAAVSAYEQGLSETQMVLQLPLNGSVNSEVNQTQ